MGGFGIHALISSIGNQISVQSAPILIGHYWPARFVGYYNLPVKLLQYTIELVARIGLVTNSNAAELTARREAAALARLAVFPNRYCLVAFMPMAIMLLGYGDYLLRLWVGEAFGAQSAPILPVLLAGMVVAHVGQFSSTMLLQGMARNQEYAKGLLAEGLLGVILMVCVIPRYGIMGCAIVSSVLLVLNRAIYVSWLTASVVKIPFWSYLTDIYLPPFLSAIPATVLIYWMRSLVSGNSFLEMAAAGFVCCLAYYPIAWFGCILPQDRRLVWGMLKRVIPGSEIRRKVGVKLLDGNSLLR
jgi:O-antigen/teichoic acid export membrane protein